MWAVAGRKRSLRGSPFEGARYAENHYPIVLYGLCHYLKPQTHEGEIGKINLVILRFSEYLSIMVSRCHLFPCDKTCWIARMQWGTAP